jgi:hypothetical protein
MDLRRSLGIRGLGVSLVALTFVAVAAAKPKDSKDLVLRYEATIAGAHLASGDYNVSWKTHSPEATITFMQGKKVVATVEGKVVDRGTRYSVNQVLYTEGQGGGRQIQEIRFRGSSEVIVFTE